MSALSGFEKRATGFLEGQTVFVAHKVFLCLSQRVFFSFHLLRYSAEPNTRWCCHRQIAFSRSCKTRALGWGSTPTAMVTAVRIPSSLQIDLHCR